MDISKVAAAGIVAVVLSLAVKKHSPEMAVLVSLAAGAVIFTGVCEVLGEVVSLFKALAENSGLKSQYIAIVFKITGIAYITEFAVRLCADANETAVAANVELAGKVLVMAASAPIIAALLDGVLNLLG